MRLETCIRQIIIKTLPPVQMKFQTLIFAFFIFSNVAWAQHEERFHNAVKNDQLALAKDLVMKGASLDVNRKDHNGHSPLMSACMLGHFELVRWLLTHISVDINSSDNNGHTILWWASHYGHLEVIKLVITHREKELKDNDLRDSVEVAKSRGHDDVVSALESFMKGQGKIAPQPGKLSHTKFLLMTPF